MQKFHDAQSKCCFLLLSLSACGCCTYCSLEGSLTLQIAIIFALTIRGVSHAYEQKCFLASRGTFDSSASLSG